jgi:CDP-glucose 4,6-dehydratase
MGTVNFLEALRAWGKTRAALVITTDKVYDNREWFWGYRENEPLGGRDPYSASKACSEIVTAAYRDSFFSSSDSGQEHKMALSTARVGNVFAGGDWAKDRLVPDCLRSFMSGQTLVIRYPNAVRPWQHVLEPLAGYLILCEKMVEAPFSYCESWNFGPDEDSTKTVRWIVEKLSEFLGCVSEIKYGLASQPHEAAYLKLDSSKAREKLGWVPRWSIGTSLSKVIEWHRRVGLGQKAYQVCLDQISDFMKSVVST